MQGLPFAEFSKIDHKFAEGKHDICILRGTWDGRDAIVKKVKRMNNLEETKYMIQISGYHENLVNFYRWETLPLKYAV
ncbi:hypothetical protein Tco_0233799 [Tanacetum coccineum]